MAGIVYVLTNEGMPGLVKIGRTDRSDPSARMADLYSTGVPFPFECVKAIELADNGEAARLEAALHRAFSTDRVNPRREFFRMDEARVSAILNTWPRAQDATERAQREVAEGTDAQDQKALTQAKQRRPTLDMAALGIRNGDELRFVGGSEEVMAEVVDASEKRLCVEGQDKSFRVATLDALGKPHDTPIRPAAYWSWNGRKLDDLYNEAHGGE